MTVSLEGMEEGVGGRGFINASGVFGGSMLGAAFFHASRNVESTAGASVTSVEKAWEAAWLPAAVGWRAPVAAAAVARNSKREPWRNMAQPLSSPMNDRLDIGLDKLGRKIQEV